MKSHVVETKQNDKMESEPKVKNSVVKSIDSAVFDAFKGLTSSNDGDRVVSGLQLLQHLAKTKNSEKKEKEAKYVLMRLVRGVGASTTNSRAGFFTTLVGFLQTGDGDRLDVENVLEIVRKQLNVGVSVNNKEDADAIVGQILTCGALIRSKKIVKGTDEDIQNITRTLIQASKFRTYHRSLAYSFLVELLENSSDDQFTTSVWPIIEPELARPWEKQTINTVHCLIVATLKFPSTITEKYLKTKFGGHSLLNSTSSKHLFKLFWENTSAGAISHPSYESFGKYVATSKHFEKFWLSTVDECLASPTKLCEIETLKVFTDVLAVADSKTLQVSKLLTENFMSMAMASLKTAKLKKDDTVKEFYREFFEGLFKWTAKVEDDSEKVAIIKKLIFHPGSVTIEKYTTQRIIHQIIAHLGESGIKEVFEVFKNIFLTKIVKNPTDADITWLNTERQCAGFMLQILIGHKSVQTSYEWRTAQLKFMMVVGLFYTNDGVEVIGKKDDNGTITADLAQQMKNILYTSLQSKLPRIQDEKKILFSLVELCEEILQRKNYAKYLRNPVDEKILKAWKEMHAEVLKTSKRENKLRQVFHILLLHMGLQLFREPEMAEAAIWDLEKCIEKTNQKKAKKATKNEGELTEEEPEWIEVVVDLFLHLLSHNTSSLKHIVNAVFPHLCDNLSLTAIHQILSVLDMQSGKNPLSEKNEELDDENMESEEDEGKEDASSSDDGNSDESDDEDDEELVEEEEEGNYTDVLRNAVSTALIGNRRDTDQDSIDLNDMDEEEGNRLDEALANIFKSMKKPKQYKKTKGYRVEITTTMHFRIRVLDLIDIYIQQKPNLLITIEIMITLFNMIEFCTETELKPLASKVEKVLIKLTGLRHFSVLDDVTEKNICDYLRLVIEKKVKAPAFEIHNKIKSKCCVFLIDCSKNLPNSTSTVGSSAEIFNLLTEYLDDFIKSRNPTVTITLLNDVFKMRWPGIWQLAKHLTEKGLCPKTRTFRRIQIIELLDTLYKNHELIRQDLKLSKRTLKSIEKHIQDDIASLAGQNQVSVREFNTLLNVISSAHRCHTKIESIQSRFDTATICEHIQSIRKKTKLENLHSYTRFCQVYGTKAIHNSEVVAVENGGSNLNGHTTLENGTIEADENSDAEEIQTENKKKKNKEKSGKKKNRETNSPAQTNGNHLKRKQSDTIDARKEKKLRKELRLKIASKGMDVTESVNE